MEKKHDTLDYSRLSSFKHMGTPVNTFPKKKSLFRKFHNKFLKYFLPRFLPVAQSPPWVMKKYLFRQIAQSFEMTLRNSEPPSLEIKYKADMKNSMDL